jgi:hypothetical protein
MPTDPSDPPAIIPPRLAEDLRALHGAPAAPEYVTGVVLRRVRREREEAEIRRRNRFRLQQLGAAAAGVALFVLVARLVTMRTPPTGPGLPAPSGGGSLAAEDRALDLTGDGSVDILDAFRLARLLEGGPVAPKAPDVNADGRVDRGDVDAIAMRAVRLGGAG